VWGRDDWRRGEAGFGLVGNPQKRFVRRIHKVTRPTRFNTHPTTLASVQFERFEVADAANGLFFVFARGGGVAREFFPFLSRLLLRVRVPSASEYPNPMHQLSPKQQPAGRDGFFHARVGILTLHTRRSVEGRRRTSVITPHTPDDDGRLECAGQTHWILFVPVSGVG